MRLPWLVPLLAASLGSISYRNAWRNTPDDATVRALFGK
jgi:hypothetical protein